MTDISSSDLSATGSDGAGNGGSSAQGPAPFFDQDVSGNACFLCGTPLVDKAGDDASPAGSVRTREHVVPQWILRDHEMFDQALTLPNKTLLSYRQVVIPACRTCNSGHLKTIEDAVAAAFRSGTAAVRQLDRRVLYLWLAKMYYGLRYRELSLPIDQADPSSLRIVDADELRSFSFLHTLLQGARDLVDWTQAAKMAGHDIPGSIIILPAQISTDAKYNFGFVDSTEHPYIAVRVGTTAVLAVLEDWGAWERSWTGITEPDPMFPELFAAKNLTLTPDQFVEISVLTDHLNQNFRRNRSYLQLRSSIDGQVGIMLAGVSPVRSTSLDSQWFTEYAQHLAVMTRQDPRTLYNPETGQRSTLLVDTDMRPRETVWSGRACVDPRCDHSAPTGCRT